MATGANCSRASGPIVSIVTPVYLHDMMLSALAGRSARTARSPRRSIVTRRALRATRRSRRARSRASNHEFRFPPARQLALEIVRAGGIGRPYRAEILGRYPIQRPARAMNWLPTASAAAGIWARSARTTRTRLRLPFPASRKAREPAWTSPSARRARQGEAPGVATADDGDRARIVCERRHGARGSPGERAPYRWERFEVHRRRRRPALGRSRVQACGGS